MPAEAMRIKVQRARPGSSSKAETSEAGMSAIGGFGEQGFAIARPEPAASGRSIEPPEGDFRLGSQSIRVVRSKT